MSPADKVALIDGILAASPVKGYSKDGMSVEKHSLKDILDASDRVNALAADLDDAAEGNIPGIAVIQFEEPGPAEAFS